MQFRQFHSIRVSPLIYLSISNGTSCHPTISGQTKNRPPLKHLHSTLYIHLTQSVNRFLTVSIQLHTDYPILTLSSTLLYTLLFACGPKQPAVQNASEPAPTVPEPQQSQPAEDRTEEDPTANIPVGAPLGSLDKSIIDAKVKEVLPDVKACYNEGLTTQPDLTGRVVIKMVIGKDGMVSSAESNPEKTTLDSAEVLDCIARKVAQLEFPPPNGGGIVIVHYPFAFSQ